MIKKYFLIGITFFSAFPVFAVFSVGNSFGVQVSLILAILWMVLFLLNSLKNDKFKFNYLFSDFVFLAAGLAIPLTSLFQILDLTSSEYRLLINNYLGGFMPTMVVYFSIRSCIKSFKEIETITKWLIISAVVSCIYGSLDYILVYIYKHNNLSWLYNNPSFSGLGWGISIDSSLSRARGFMSEPNIFAGFLLSIIPIAILQRSFAVIVVLFIGMFLTASYVIFLLIPLLIFMVFSRSGMELIQKYLKEIKPSHIFSKIAILTISIILVNGVINKSDSNSIISRIISRMPESDLTVSDESSMVRLDTIIAGWKLFSEKPFLGHGFGTLSAKVPLYLSNETFLISPEGQKGIHSALFSILATNGIVGFLIFFIWALSIIFPLKKMMKRFPTQRMTIWAWKISFIFQIMFFTVSSSEWPALYFFPIVAAVSSSLPMVCVYEHLRHNEASK